jgi:hypothetical protein
VTPKPSSKRKPEFRVGQVVMCDLAGKALKIHKRWKDGQDRWWYEFFHHHPEEQSSLRAQTERERGRP